MVTVTKNQWNVKKVFMYQVELVSKVTTQDRKLLNLLLSYKK